MGGAIPHPHMLCMYCLTACWATRSQEDLRLPETTSLTQHRKYGIHQPTAQQDQKEGKQGMPRLPSPESPV